MKVIAINQDGILFDDGTTVQDHHEQDCCERVYADFQQLRDTDILSSEIQNIIIEPVQGSGFRINGYFVPCYNKQNGYYSSNLVLNISKNGTVHCVDIGTCTQYIEY